MEEMVGYLSKKSKTKVILNMKKKAIPPKIEQYETKKKKQKRKNKRKNET